MMVAFVVSLSFKSHLSPGLQILHVRQRTLPFMQRGERDHYSKKKIWVGQLWCSPSYLLHNNPVRCSPRDLVYLSAKFLETFSLAGPYCLFKPTSKLRVYFHYSFKPRLLLDRWRILLAQKHAARNSTILLLHHQFDHLSMRICRLGMTTSPAVVRLLIICAPFSEAIPSESWAPSIISVSWPPSKVIPNSGRTHGPFSI